ncbi:hypothetical protein MBLNU459_g7043t1 [Dothideomycetes sp. NU459]
MQHDTGTVPSSPSPAAQRSTTPCTTQHAPYLLCSSALQLPVPSASPPQPSSRGRSSSSRRSSADGTERRSMAAPAAGERHALGRRATEPDLSHSTTGRREAEADLEGPKTRQESGDPSAASSPNRKIEEPELQRRHPPPPALHRSLVGPPRQLLPPRTASPLLPLLLLLLLPQLQLQQLLRRRQLFSAPPPPHSQPAPPTLTMSAAAVLSRASGRLCSRSALAQLRARESVARTPALAALARYYASKSFPPHTVITMPALSPTMTAGNIGTWQKTAGDTLAPGDVLVEIETDKAQMDFEFQEDGVLAKILKDSGAKDVAVGNPIAVMIEEGGDVAAFESFSVEDAGGEKSAESSGSKQEDANASEPASNDTKTAPAPATEDGSSSSASSSSSSSSSSSASAAEPESTGERLQTSLERQPAVSPAAKKLALEKGVAIGQIKGSGPGGRVTKQDIEKFKPAAAAAAGPAAAAAAGAPAYEDTPASSMRKTIAARLTQSMNQNPHYFVQSSVSVGKLLKLRQALNAAADGKYKLSVNDFLVKALAMAARKVPAANSSWREDGSNVYIRQHNVVDVSVAVATPIGLMTPIVKNVAGTGLESISAQIKDLGKRARDGKLKPEEYQGGTITISNMGMNAAIDRFTAVINPPQATILAVGAVKKVAVPAENDDGTTGVEWDEQIVLSGSFDHKVVDGAVGGEFMKELKAAIENPLSLML